MVPQILVFLCNKLSEVVHSYENSLDKCGDLDPNYLAKLKELFIFGLGCIHMYTHSHEHVCVLHIYPHLASHSILTNSPCFVISPCYMC
jgi:hypothetical protein